MAKICILPLVCVLLPLFAEGQRSPGCEYNNVVYPVGSSFEMGCSAVCHCANREGMRHCVSMCPPVLYPEYCRMVKKVAQCCETGDCNVNETCQPFDSFANKPNITVAPWQVKIAIGANGDRKCHATIISKKRYFHVILYVRRFVPADTRWASQLITTSECISILEKVSFLMPPSNWKVALVTKRSGFPYSLMHLASPLTYLRTVHEINLPWPHTCTDAACGVWVTSASRTGVEYIQAKKAPASKCDLSEATEQLSCLEIQQYGSKCVNFDQASVLIRKGENYHLVGIMSGGPTKKLPNGDCDVDQPRYRKYVNLCHKSNGIIETEWLASKMND